ncbi:MAG: hypothetical protein WBO35_00980 [Candidatus Saccharimonadales bacterium]
MEKREVTSKAVDEVLKYGLTGVAISAGILLPNALIALDKPLQKLYRHLDERDRCRELRRIIYNMKAQGYLAGNYEHGLQLTDKAKKRLAKIEIESLAPQPQKTWDHLWRIVIYDIPFEHNYARQQLTATLHEYGFFQLQKSTWINPFPCREDIEAICTYYNVSEYVTYFEALKLDNSAALIRRFARKYPATLF